MCIVAQLGLLGQAPRDPHGYRTCAQGLGGGEAPHRSVAGGAPLGRGSWGGKAGLPRAEWAGTNVRADVLERPLRTDLALVS